MGVTDIIGVDAGQGLETVDESGNISKPYQGFDPALSKLFYSLFCGGNVVLGVWMALNKWHMDGLNSDTTTYEGMIRLAIVSLLIFYSPTTLSYMVIEALYRYELLANVTTSTLIPYRTFYVISFWTIGMPMLAWFGVEIIYLYAYIQGNSSGLAVTNRASYFLSLASIITYQGISLMAAIMALPGIKTWYDGIVVERAELDESRQNKKEEEIGFCEEGGEGFGEAICDDEDVIEARL